MNTEKLKERRTVLETTIWDEISLDELREIINSAEKEAGAETVEFYASASYDRCGDYEGTDKMLIFYKYELETDKEYEDRLERNRKECERTAREAEEKRKKEELTTKKKIEDEQMKLLELMEKYPELAGKK